MNETFNSCHATAATWTLQNQSGRPALSTQGFFSGVAAEEAVE